MLTGARKLSGLQKEVLSLYRTIIREAVKKDRQGASESAGREFPVTTLLKNDTITTTSYARDEFRRQAAVASRSDFKVIEYQIRKGHKQVKLMKMPGVQVVSGTR